MPTVPIWTDTAMQGDTELRERWLYWWNKDYSFQLKWWDSLLTLIFRVECIIKLAKSGRLLLWFNCVKCSFVWFCLCCFLCLQWSKDRPLLSHVPLSSGFPSVLLLQCNHGVLLLNIVIECCFSCRNKVWQQFNCAWGKKKDFSL